jgi:hypothetical protein
VMESPSTTSSLAAVEASTEMMSKVVKGGVGTVSGTNGDPDSQVLRLGPYVEHLVGTKTIRSRHRLGGRGRRHRCLKTSLAMCR